MPPISSEAGGAPAARPYGLLGLILSTFVIFAAATAILLAVAAVAFGGLAARDGWQTALWQVTDFQHTLASNQDAADRANIVGGTIVYVVTALSVLIVARFRGRAAWSELVGWQPWDMGRNLPFILLLLAGTLFYSLIASSLIERIHPEAKDWVPTPNGTPWIIGFLAMATLFAPVTEELLFRGWIYTSLRGIIGVPFGILVSSAVFALAHWESTHLYALAVFPVGLALGYIRQRTGSLAASITFHSLYNGVAAVLLFAGK